MYLLSVSSEETIISKITHLHPHRHRHRQHRYQIQIQHQWSKTITTHRHPKDTKWLLLNQSVHLSIEYLTKTLSEIFTVEQIQSYYNDEFHFDSHRPRLIDNALNSITMKRGYHIGDMHRRFVRREYEYTMMRATLLLMQQRLRRLLNNESWWYMLAASAARTEARFACWERLRRCNRPLEILESGSKFPLILGSNDTSLRDPNYCRECQDL